MAAVQSFPRELPVGTIIPRSLGWWAMVWLIATEAALFAYLFFSYYYLESQSTNPWPPSLPPLRYALPSTAALIIASIALWWAERAIRRVNRPRMLIGTAIACLLTLLYVILQLLEWGGKPFALSTDAYSSLYFVISGFHMLHALVGVIIFAMVFLWGCLGYVSAERHTMISIGALYSYFLLVVWIGVFATFYIVPYLS